MRGQKLFIEIGLHCLKFLDWQTDDMKTKYTESLYLVFQRAELDLAMIGFSMEIEENILNNKVKMGIDFCYLMNKALFMCIDKMNRKSVDFYQRDFLTYFLAIAYFRIPVFQETFLELI